MFEVSNSLIRYWESEFESLKPHKNTKGDRRFTKENIEQLQVIHHLVKERKFTLAGAKEEMKAQKMRRKNRAGMITELNALKDFLQGLKAQL